MNFVRLTSNGLVRSRHYQTEDVSVETAADILPLLGYDVEIEDGFTLGDLIALIDKPGFEALGAILGEHIESVLDEARDVAGDSDRDDDIHYLHVYNDGANGGLFRGFGGWGEIGEPYPGAWEEDPDIPREGALAVGLSPLRDLLHLPLRYDPEVVFRNKKFEEVYRTELPISLFDFLKAVFYELTFYGTASERDAMLADLKERIREIEDGEVELIPAEEVFESLRDRLGVSGEEVEDLDS